MSNTRRTRTARLRAVRPRSGGVWSALFART